jgi:iron-sulfur cluster assembly protein
MTATIVVSEKALEQLLLLDVNRENFLRLWVEQGGCSGMLYQAAIDTEESPTDNVLYQDDNLRILTDIDSLPHFDGVQIDYSDDLVASGFRFTNPNAVRTCGCGSSFQCGQ